MKISLNYFIFALIIVLLMLYNTIIDKQDVIQFDRMSSTFSDIYINHKWVRGSGRGSDKECTDKYRSLLYEILKEYNIKSIIDYGCGDWKMLSSFKFDENQTYVGYDIVELVIEANKRKFSSKNIKFYKINNSLDELFPADIIMIKDVFQHWNNRNILNFIKHILPKYKYSLITNTYNYTQNNKDIEIGKCRSLDLEDYPFNMNSILKKDMYFCSELKRIYLFKKEYI